MAGIQADCCEIKPNSYAKTYFENLGPSLISKVQNGNSFAFIGVIGTQDDKKVKLKSPTSQSVLDGQDPINAIDGDKNTFFRNENGGATDEWWKALF